MKMSQTPTPTELASIQESWNVWFTDTCNIEREVMTEGDYGEESTVTVVAADVPCGLTSVVLPGVQQVIATRQAKVADTTISFAKGTDIQVADDVILTSQNNRRFETLYVEAPQSYQAGEQAYLREVL
jgi:hypothetical protein